MKLVLILIDMQNMFKKLVLTAWAHVVNLCLWLSDSFVSLSCIQLEWKQFISLSVSVSRQICIETESSVIKPTLIHFED